MDKDEIIKTLEEKNVKLEEELQATQEHLKKYTAPASRKVYYENNKEAVIERVKFRLSPLQISKRKRKKLDHRR